MGVMCISQIVKINPESFFVDTNIWINCFFHPMKQPIRQTIDKSKKYLNFFEKIAKDGGKIFTSSLCYSELFSAIEKFYWRNFKIDSNLNECTLKSYRKHTSYSRARDEIMDDVDIAWKELSYYAQILAFTFDDKLSLSETLKSNSLLDAHDAVYLKIMSLNNIKNIITEDSDFNEIKNIDVYHV